MWRVDIGVDKEPLNRTQKVLTLKEKKLNFMKIKNFYLQKYMINKGKMQAINWEEIFAMHMSDKGLVLRMYKELQLKQKRRQPIFKKWSKDFNIHFKKEDIELANKHMKRCLI